MPDPGWAARTPEANDLLLKAGTGVGTHLANQTAWTTLGASHHASGVASAINTAATAASWLGVGSAASALNVTMLNATLHGLAGWVDVKPAVVSTAIAAFETANAAMRPAPECMENRDEWGVDNAINPSVLWTLTPRIVSLDVEYFGVMWPNNAAVGATYGGVLAALAESLAIPPPVATMGASPAAPAQAAAALAEFDIPAEVRVVSAHRTPEAMFSYARGAAERGLEVIIAGAGGAAHLPGMVAAATPLPVIGVPVPLGRLDGLDSLLSIVQMPAGVPVATVSIGGAGNAGLLAVRMLGAANPQLRARIVAFQDRLADVVAAKDAELQRLAGKLTRD